MCGGLGGRGLGDGEGAGACVLVERAAYHIKHPVYIRDYNR